MTKDHEKGREMRDERWAPKGVNLYMYTSFIVLYINTTADVVKIYVHERET